MNPILIDFPNEIITDRLLLRMPMAGDGQYVYEAIMASLADLRPWLPFANQEQSLENTEANIREAQSKFLKREDLRLLIFDKHNHNLIGSSGLHNPNWVVRKFEIGYWIDSRYQGNGYMTEAVEGITGFAFSELEARRVEIRCDEKNIRSRAIPERLNYELEGILRNDDVAPHSNELRNTCIYSKIR
ncbi:GNAT family N-acetyltransferase [Paenibacillus senegalensis]|uniref:GNAT family N-acetyltransferase n=1 Tax=Paenibacillus senegalensis TaxID=1465766 RepID=UPI0002899EC9|nr:GNAT family N-acetyltransferase [Paenibacillus senegalensis]